MNVKPGGTYGNISSLKGENYIEICPMGTAMIHEDTTTDRHEEAKRRFADMR
jgi:hypothetical protein